MDKGRKLKVKTRYMRMDLQNETNHYKKYKKTRYVYVQKLMTLPISLSQTLCCLSASMSTSEYKISIDFLASK